MENKKTCFVVMGFGKKTDFQTGRVLDLDKSYHAIIKPAVTDAGLDCRRADEFVVAGTIDTPMYEQLLLADVVVADVSTYNCNAFYELGVRHALRPFTTITIAEDKMTIPFDVNHVTVRRYHHMGDGIDYDEVMRMRDALRAAIEAIAQKPADDSPVYTFLSGLKPPVREMASVAAAGKLGGAPPAAAVAASDQSATVVNLAMQSYQQTQNNEKCGDAGTPENPTVSSLMESAQAAIDASDFISARAILQAVKRMAPRDSYVTQKLAMSTYKSKQPTAPDALREAVAILQELATTDSTDTETLGLWGAIHKRLWELAGDPADLDIALAAHQKAFVLKNDYWNGINLAYLYSERAGRSTDQDEAEADRVMAKRTRKKVLDICQSLYDAKPDTLDNTLITATHRYWLLATMAEAWLGLGNEAKVKEFLAEAAQQKPAKWMLDSTAEQMERLRKLL